MPAESSMDPPVALYTRHCMYAARELAIFYPHAKAGMFSSAPSLARGRSRT